MKYRTDTDFRADSKQMQMVNGKQKIDLEWPKAIAKFIIIIYLICQDRVAPIGRARSYKLGCFPRHKNGKTAKC